MEITGAYSHRARTGRRAVTTTPPCVTTWTVRVWSPPTLPSPSQAALSIFSPWVWPSYPMVRSTSSIFLQVKLKWKLLSRVWLFVTPWTTQSVEFSRPEYWSGYPFLSPGDLLNPGVKPRFPALQVDSLPATISLVNVLSLHLHLRFLFHRYTQITCQKNLFPHWFIYSKNYVPDTVLSARDTEMNQKRKRNR